MTFTRTAVAMHQPNDHDPEVGLGKRECLDFELLYLLETRPGHSQREIAEQLGVSLGRINYGLKALYQAGALKIARFRSAESGLGCFYALSPKGLAERKAMTGRFLRQKLLEYEHIKAQIEQLQRELNRDDQGS
jgi:EPS-associated MarR family transcriptional regulator